MFDKFNQGFGKFGPMEQCDDGEWMRVEDHEKVLEQYVSNEYHKLCVDTWRDWCNDLQMDVRKYFPYKEKFESAIFWVTLSGSALFLMGTLFMVAYFFTYFWGNL